MGAELWYHEVPWQADPILALRAFQATFFSNKYQFEQMLVDFREEARRAMQLERESGDRFGLASIFQSQLEVIESAEAQGLPTDINTRIGLMRQVLGSISPDGFGNILDVVDIRLCLKTPRGRCLRRLVAGVGAPPRRISVNTARRRF